MKILLANYIIGGNTGSETWVYTMKKELENRGHSVMIFSLSNSKVHIKDIIEYNPDLAIINHNNCLTYLKGLKCKKIFTSHGVIPSQEQPVIGADVYVSVSEEVQDNLKSKGFDSVVIRNGIDTELYKSIKPTNSTLKNVLFSSRHQGKALDIITQACKELELNLTVIGGRRVINDTNKLIEIINDNDLVIGLGRTAYEAMSCERNVIVYDYLGADGFVTTETIKEYRYNNCSGRCNKKELTVEELKEMLLQYDYILGHKLREYIKDNNDIVNVLDKYLKI